MTNDRELIGVPLLPNAEARAELPGDHPLAQFRLSDRARRDIDAIEHNQREGLRRAHDFWLD